MRKNVILIVAALAFVTASSINAQVTEEWVARYDGPASGEDRACAIAVDDSGNVYVTGWSEVSIWDYDYTTIKYNSTGTEEWVARYDGPGNDRDKASAMAIDGSGNVYVTGYSGFDYATVKYNPVGNQEWVARYDGPASGEDVACAIAIDDAGNVYVTGYSDGSGIYPDYATVKYNPVGNQEWVARYDGAGNGIDGACAIAIDDAGNVYVTGGSWGSGTDPDYATIKYNPSGIEEWVARYDGPGNYSDWDEARAIALDDSGNVYVTGYSCGSGTHYDYVTIKYNSAGTEEWVARYHNLAGGWDDEAYAIAIDDTGNVYVTGYSDRAGTDEDYATVKYSSDGEEQWVEAARYNGPGNGNDGANALTVDGSGNVYVTGWSVGSGTNYDYATVKYDPAAGTEEWVMRYNGPANDSDYAQTIALDGSGNVYVTGSSVGSGTDYDYATIKYSQGPGVAEAPKSSPILVSTSLNRLSYELSGSASLILYSADGRKVLEEMVEGQGIWEASVSLAQGVYFCRMQAGSFTASEKLILIR